MPNKEYRWCCGSVPSYRILNLRYHCGWLLAARDLNVSENENLDDELVLHAQFGWLVFDSFWDSSVTTYQRLWITMSNNNIQCFNLVCKSNRSCKIRCSTIFSKRHIAADRKLLVTSYPFWVSEVFRPMLQPSLVILGQTAFVLLD